MLNERKIKILEAIINDYIATAEPIGSRTIAKKYDLGISSATIRNEMSDLEELGFIIQPHASAGRVPSDKGYRLYVDNLMTLRELTDEQATYLQNIVSANINHIDYLMEQTAKALSLLTHYTTIVSEPHAKHPVVKHIQLIPLDDSSVIAVVVTDTKVVKNHIIKISSVPDEDTLDKISKILNKNLQNCAAEQINSGLISEIEKELGAYSDLLQPILNAVLETVITSQNVNVYTSGVKNILEFPEFSNVDKARAIFETLEEKEMLITILGHGLETNSEAVQILIGNENSIEGMKNCSIIRANYNYGDNSYGSIGIIGPTRMNYTQAVTVLNVIVKNINNVIKALSGG